MEATEEAQAGWEANAKRQRQRASSLQAELWLGGIGRLWVPRRAAKAELSEAKTQLAAENSAPLVPLSSGAAGAACQAVCFSGAPAPKPGETAMAGLSAARAWPGMACNQNVTVNRILSSQWIGM